MLRLDLSDGYRQLVLWPEDDGRLTFAVVVPHLGGADQVLMSGTCLDHRGPGMALADVQAWSSGEHRHLLRQRRAASTPNGTPLGDEIRR